MRIRISIRIRIIFFILLQRYNSEKIQSNEDQVHRPDFTNLRFPAGGVRRGRQQPVIQRSTVDGHHQAVRHSAENHLPAEDLRQHPESKEMVQRGYRKSRLQR